ncbi:MAG: hypothetical protein CFE24_00950 [Flavobacterium sp. BFFFF2]|nr:MAG: hypothetical protein CFE24_00950 [Flavobacterium sp. BFFFF2]
MHLNDLTFLLHKPEAMNAAYAQSLEQVLETFPYFQSARVLHLKQLYQQESYLYNGSLKSTAAYTYDRGVLFDFITSDSFTSVHKGSYVKNPELLNNMQVIDSEWVQPNEQLPFDPTPIASSIDATVVDVPLPVEEKLNIGKPLRFLANEKHSFQEWLQLTRFQPINRDENTSELNAEVADQKSKKTALIDRFIETNPKIVPVPKDMPVAPLKLKEDIPTPLMTETLAQVYLEQKKYAKAIQAYEILILKYPEKSSFFADRISDIKQLQQHTSN